MMQTWHIRQATAADRSFLEQLAPRLTIGIPAWRDAELMRATMLRFLLDDLANMGEDSTMLIAETAAGAPVGVATIGRSKHFTGQEQAELGELAVTDETEGQGAGAALLAAAEAWARERGFSFVALGTGAANTRARDFYARHGYAEEDVRLAKPL
jgi:GNAT superfamily N-acetyltransferase